MAIKDGQSRETGNIGYTRRRKPTQKYNTICVGHHYTQTDTNNVNNTWALLHVHFNRFSKQTIVDLSVRKVLNYDI